MEDSTGEKKLKETETVSYIIILLIFIVIVDIIL